MEALFNAALEAISLSSPTGLSLPDLWLRLTDPAASLGAAALPPTMRKAIWQMLTERKDDIIAAAAAVPLGQEPQIISWDAPETSSYTAAEAANIHLIASPAMQDASLGVYAARLNRFQLSLPQRQTLRILGEAKGRGALQSVLTTALGIENRNYSYVIKNLEERGLVAKCPTVLQKGGGHVTSTNLIVLTKFAPEEMTDPQARLHDGKSSTMQILDPKQASGSGRRGLKNRAGGEESAEDGGGSSGDDEDDIGFDDLGGVAGIAPGGGGAFGSAALSSVQCLDKYGNLDQKLAAAGDAAGLFSSSTAAGAGPSSTAAGNGLHMVLDDDMYLRKITTLLASLPDHSMNETDLKKELGYIGRRGHRRWRRLRSILEKKKCIERFKAREGVNGSIVFIVKLLKAYTIDGDDEWTMAALLDPLTGKLNVFGEQVAELTLDRQILTMLAAAGSDGVTTQQVDVQLRFNIKRNEPRFKELKMRYGQGSVVEQHINQGKVRLLRYNATPELLTVLDSALQGVSADGGGGALAPPPGGYVNAVQEAIAAGLNEDGTNPLAKYNATTGTAQGEGEEGGDVVAELLAGQTAAAPGQTAAPTVAGEATTATAATAAAEVEGDDDEDNDEDEDVAGPSNKPAAAERGKRKNATNYAPSRRKKQPLTEMAKLRRQWIVERVNRENLLLCSEIGSYLQSTEKAVRNNPNAVRPDRKVIQRLIDAAVEANEVTVLRVTFPGVHGSLTNRTHDVLAKPGTQADAEFVDLVFAAHRDMQKRIRQLSSAAITNKHEDPVGEMLPIVAQSKAKEETAAKKKAAKQGNKGDRKHGGDADGGDGTAADDGDGQEGAVTAATHGFIGARMQRVWKIHEIAWKLLDARNGAPSPYLNQSLISAAAEGKVFLVGHAPASFLGGRPLDMGVYQGTPEQQAVVLTTDEFWKALTVEDFLACLGSKSTDAALVQELKASNKRMGELRRKELIALAGGIDALTAAKGNLTKYLDIMTRMGLISAVVPFGEGKNLASAGSASFSFKRAIQYEEPIRIVEPPPPITTITATATTAAAAAAAAVEGASPATGGAAPTAGPSGINTLSLQQRTSLETKLHTFDATTVEGRTAYWMSMQYMIMCSPLASGLRGRVGQKTLLTDCFPFSRATEAMSERSWTIKTAVLTERVDELVERISTMVLPQPGHMSLAGVETPQGDGDGDGEEGVPGASNLLTWERALELAKEVDVPFETVARAVTRAQMQRVRGVLNANRRLGALGGRGGGGSSASRRRHRYDQKRRKRRRGRDSDEDTDEENQEGLFDLELGGSGGEGDDEDRPVKQRKKKWFAEEDRELLHAWATWLAAKGPDKILRWKFIKARPRGLMPISCKYRIQVLKANESSGPMMMKILEVAGAVHSRRVLRGASGGGGGAATATEPATAEEAEVGEKRKSDDDYDDGTESTQPASKKARGEDGSAVEAPAPAVTTDLPPLWPISDSEDAAALQLVVDEIENVVRVAPSRYKHGMKKPEHAKTGTGGDYEPSGGAGGGSGGGGGGDRRVKSVLGSLGGRLLGPAARGPVIIARQFTALCQWAKAAAAARASGTARPPMPSVSMAMELVKSLLLAVKEKEEEDLHHHTGLGNICTVMDTSFATALTDRFSASDIKEAIAELIRLGHITLTTTTTSANTTSAHASSGGGTAGTPTVAGAGKAAGGSSSALALSTRFMVEMQPLFLHGGLYNEAHAAHAELASVPAGALTSIPKESRPAVKNLLPLGQSSNSGVDKNVLGVNEVSGGAVAAVLSKCLVSTTRTSTRGGDGSDGGGNNHAESEKAELTASLPRSVRMISTAGAAAAASQQQRQQQPATAASAGVADDESEENMLRVLSSIKVTASIRSNTPGITETHPYGSRPSSAAAAVSAEPAEAASGGLCIGRPLGQRLSLTDSNGTVHTLQFSSQEEVLYQPALVASDAKLRSAAEATCKKIFSLKKVGGGGGGSGGGDGKWMDKMLKALRAAGETGLTPSDFLSAVDSSSSTTIPEKTTTQTSAKIFAAAKCLKTSKEVEEALDAFCRCGLARRVTGYDDVRVVASDSTPTSHPPVVFPPAESTTPLATALSSLKLPPQGTVQPCVDVSIRPWVDHLGRLNPILWRALLHRAVSTVLQYPGVSGAVLLQSLRVVNPQHAREVVGVLCAAGILRGKREIRDTATKKVVEMQKKSVLAACFGDGSSSAEQQQQENGGDEENLELTSAATTYGSTAFPGMPSSNSTNYQTGTADDDSCWNFFIDPGMWWQAMEVLPPSVLVPVSD